MGWCNSILIFHNNVTYILQPKIPDFTISYINDIPCKGSVTNYHDANGNYETIANNHSI